MSVSVDPLLGQVVSVVEVRVTSRATGGPIPSASVSVLELNRASITDGNGRAILRGLPPGRHQLVVRALGYRDSEIEAEAVNGRTTYASVPLLPDPLRLRGLEVTARGGALPAGALELVPDDLGPSVVDLPGALDRLPGVTVVRRGGGGSEATVQIRGSSSGQVLILLDGIPLNSPLTGEADLTTVDLESLRRIVVLPGAQSARYGPRAMGGVILLESRSEEESTADFTLGAGSWGARLISGGGSWAPGSGWTLAAHGGWETAEGDFSYDVPEFRGGGEEERKNGGFDRAGGHLVFERRSSLIASSFRVHLTDLQRGSPGPTAQPALFGEQRHRRSGTSLRAELGDGKRGGSGIVALQWQRAEYSDPDPPLGPPYDQKARVAQREIGLAGWETIGPVLARFGGDLRSREVRADVLAAPPSKVGEAGLWTQVELDLPSGEGARGRLDFGLRADRHDLVRGTQLSPSLSTSYETSRARFELAYRNGFSPPGLADLFFQEGILVRPNPNLRPERVKGEVAATIDTRFPLGPSQVHTRFSAYRANIDDMILWSPDFQFIWSPNNFDVSRRGIELGSVVEFSFLGLGHSLGGQASWAQVEYRGGVLEGQVAYRPVFTANAEGRFGLPVGSLNLRADHVGARRSVAGTDLNSLPPYTILDLGWSSPLGLGRVSGEIELVLSNLLDERAALLVDYPLPSRGWSTRVHLAPKMKK